MTRVLLGLQEIASDPGDLEQEVRGALELGCRELGFPLGFVARVEDGEATVLERVHGESPVVPPRFPVDRTFCRAILDAGAFRSSEDASGDPGAPLGFPGAPAEVPATWVGVPLRSVHGPATLLAFASPHSRPGRIGTAERDVVEALGRHLSVTFRTMERANHLLLALGRVAQASGADLLERVAEEVSRILGTPFVLVCERMVGEPERFRTRANWSEGSLAANYEIGFAGTPCAEILAHGSFFCPDDLQARFAEDERLPAMGARSCLGVAIRDPQGQVIGQLIAFDRIPFGRSRRREGVLRLFGVLASEALARLRAESRVREQGRLIEIAAEAGHIGFWSHDVATNSLYLDENARALLGLREAKGPLEKAWGAAVDPGDYEHLRRVIEAHVRGESDVYSVEYRLRSGEGPPRWFLSHGRMVAGDDGSAERLVGVVLDTTAKKRLEEERSLFDTKVHFTQRLESLGILAGALAHDFNNLLLAILGNASLARGEVEPASRVAERLVEIEAAAQRAGDLTNQMMAYSGSADVTAERVDLSSLVREMSRLLQTVVSKKATLSLRLAEGALPIEADAAQVRQVVMDLITNASDALSDRVGDITVSTGLRSCDRRLLSHFQPDADLTEGPYVFLEVEDSGVGMDPATRAQVFDPFFTTKFGGRGLGLPAVLGILRSHGGGIRLESVPGEGTRITVLFPPAEPDEEMLEEGAEVDDASWEGQGAVLVVDDEEMVRKLMCTVLQDAGFEVLTANDGVEGLEVFEANADRIRLVLLDMMMPRMGGGEVYARLCARKPDLSIILMSGFSEEHVARDLAGDRSRFLKKPFQISALLDTVYGLLHS